MTTFIGIPARTYQTRGSNYTADPNGMIYGVAGAIDAVDLTAAGCVALAAAPHANYRNLLDGGDFTVNPWQRNIAGIASGGVISTAISSTPAYFPDRWYAYGGSSSAILMAVAANTSVPGFSQSLNLTRQSGNSNTAAINLGQVLETADTIRLQGQEVCFSVAAAPLSGYTGGQVTLAIVSGTGTNDTAAHLAAGSWSGQTTIASTTVSLPAIANKEAPAYVSAIVPATATQLAVLVSWTPSGTAGSNDGIAFFAMQLEIGSVPSQFERRDVQVEFEICQRYCWAIPEPASGVVVGSGMNTGSSSIVWYMATPVQLRAAPTVSVAAGSFKANVAGTATATTISAGSTHTPNALTIDGTGSSLTAGQGSLLQGGGGSGYILASADY